MSAIMTLGGIALAVLGLLVAFAGLPDRAAGLGLGSDLIQTGASLFAGGLIVAALGQVLRSLRDVADRVEEAGFGLSAPRQSLNDELSEKTPVPLPRANARNAAADHQDEFAEPAAPAAREPRASRAPREPQPADDFDEDFPAQRHEPRQEPRWMRAQAETGNRQQSAGVIPLQSSRQNRANPAAPARATSRELPASAGYENTPQRRRPVPEHTDEETGEVSVVRSGIIGGMAYTLYSDGAIEAELPSGMVRFNSFAELQEHVKRAGADDQDAGYRGPNAAQH